MLARDYSNISVSSNASNMQVVFPKDPGVKMSLISGVCCYGGTGGGQVAVADELKNRVVVFNPDGSKKHVVGGKGTGNAEFLTPKNLACSEGGKMAVADSGNHRLQSLDKLGQVFQCKWQAHRHEIRKGKQPGEFDG